MDNQKFEILLNKDRNWLSRYGGFVSLLLIAVLIAAIIGIDIPKYEPIQWDTKGYYYISIQDEISQSRKLGDTIKADTNDLFVLTDVQRENEKTIWHLVSLSENKNIIHSKYLIENQSLLKSLIEPVLTMNKD